MTLKTMFYITTNIQPFLKDIMMQIGLQVNWNKIHKWYIFTIDGGEISWKLFKQTCIARSTMESEFIALDKAGEEAEWLRIS